MLFCAFEVCTVAKKDIVPTAKSAEKHITPPNPKVSIHLGIDTYLKEKNRYEWIVLDSKYTETIFFQNYRYPINQNQNQCWKRNEKIGMLKA